METHTTQLSLEQEFSLRAFFCRSSAVYVS